MVFPEISEIFHGVAVLGSNIGDFTTHEFFQQQAMEVFHQHWPNQQDPTWDFTTWF